MFRYMPPIALMLWATSATAAIQNSDFWFHEDGDTVFLDGNRGAPLHIDYIGAPLTKPLKIKITPNNPLLKVSPSTCTFTPKNHDCRMSAHSAKVGEKVYGVNQFTITEIGTSQGVLNAQAASDTGTVGFGVGVQGKNMPAPISALLTASAFKWGYVPRVIISNMTSQERDYQGKIPFYAYYRATRGKQNSTVKTKKVSLAGKTSCYLDANFAQAPDATFIYPLYSPSSKALWMLSSYGISDVTNPSDPIYNFAYETSFAANISTCSAQGESGCASNKWASWNVGLANLGATDMGGGVRAGQIEVLRDNSWNNGSTIYYATDWSDANLALLLIQGSTDGTGFDAQKAAPSILEIQSAPPCSYYLKPDQSVTYTVQVKAFGPGTITMPTGGQCKNYSTPGQDFIYCTGGGYKDAWYEVTAVPDAGKTFKGWYSSGLCDDASATCRFQLTSDVTLSPNFQ